MTLLVTPNPVNEVELSEIWLKPRFAKYPEACLVQWAPDIARVAFELAYICNMSPFELAMDIAAIIWREDNGGKYLDNRGLGDNGNGYFLMQIDKRYHAPFLALKNADGFPLWHIAYENIKYATKNVYLEDFKFFKGNRRNAFSSYNGGRGAVQDALLAGTDPDMHTTGKNYGKDTLARRQKLVDAL